MSSIFKVGIIEKTEIAFDTTEVSLTRPDNFQFNAGQYIQLSIPNLLYTDPKGSSRVFSIASSPEEKDRLRLAFRNTGSGYKKTLNELEKGNLLDLEGPLGDFTLPQEETKISHVFIAGGIGITPFMSKIRSLHEPRSSDRLTLLYANRDKNSTAYIKELQDADKKKLFTLRTVFGKITGEHIDGLVRTTEEGLWWVVGPPPMVAEVSQMLRQSGVLQKTIRIESFTGY